MCKQMETPVEVGSVPSIKGGITRVGKNIVSVGSLSKDVEIFNFESGTWKLASWKLDQAIEGFCTVAMSENEFLVIGGVNSQIGR